MATKQEKLAAQLKKEADKHQAKMDAIAKRIADEQAKAVVIDPTDAAFVKLMGDVASVAKKYNTVPLNVINSMANGLFGDGARVVARKARKQKAPDVK